MAGSLHSFIEVSVYTPTSGRPAAVEPPRRVCVSCALGEDTQRLALEQCPQPLHCHLHQLLGCLSRRVRTTLGMPHATTDAHRHAHRGGHHAAAAERAAVPLQPHHARQAKGASRVAARGSAGGCTQGGGALLLPHRVEPAAGARRRPQRRVAAALGSRGLCRGRHGGLAGEPAAVVKFRMQRPEWGYTGVVHAVRTIYNTEGPFAFWKGGESHYPPSRQLTTSQHTTH